MPFEPELGIAFMGEVTSIEVLDPAGHQPKTVVKIGDPWEVKVKWETEGVVVGTLAGTWHVSAFLESIGAGFEGQVGPTMTVDVATGGTCSGNKCEYETTIGVPAGTPPNAVSYLSAVTILYRTLANLPGPYAAHVAGPMLQFFVNP